MYIRKDCKQRKGGAVIQCVTGLELERTGASRIQIAMWDTINHVSRLVAPLSQSQHKHN